MKKEKKREQSKIGNPHTCVSKLKIKKQEKLKKDTGTCSHAGAGAAVSLCLAYFTLYMWSCEISRGTERGQLLVVLCCTVLISKYKVIFSTVLCTVIFICLSGRPTCTLPGSKLSFLLFVRIVDLCSFL